MPASRRLSSLVEDGVDVRGCLRAVARIMAVAHARPPVGADLSDVATPGALHELWDASLGQLATFSPVPIERERLDTIRWLAHRFLAGRTPLLAERLDRGLVVDGHGDLMADDIFCLPDGPRILDCLEFDDRLRWGDVVNDVGFLAMDLDRLGRPGLARFFLDQYREFSAETHPVSLEHHYVAYRALVRAKVACLRGGAAAEIEAREHVARCERHLREGRIRLVLIGGLPGTGKSTVAAHLGRRLGWTVLRSDEIRKQRAGLDALDPVTVSFGADVYSSSVTTSTYTEMLADAGRLLDHGESVILDASFSQQRWRAAARDMAARSATDVVELRCVLPADIAAARLVERRRRRVDASDATAAIAATMADRFDPWPGSLEVETTAAPGDLTAALLAHLDAVPANVGSGSG
jgi:predicted kinase